MAAYTFGQLEDFWTQAGGPRKLAPTMAAIALAESGGRNIRQKGQPAARTGWGLWQITPGDPSLLDPRRNAKAAVAKYRSQGLRAWSTYTTGTYRTHLDAAVSGPSGGSFGIYSSAHYAGADQGVDFTGAGVIPALDPITITSVRHVSIIEGGSWPLVGFRFDAGPYKGRYGYVMENFQPTVKVGQRLKRGQPIGRAAGSFPYIETGFASGPEGSPLAPLSQSDPHGPTAAGLAYASYIGQRIGSPLVASPDYSQRGSSSGKPRGAPAGGFWSDVKGVLTWSPFPNPAAQAGADTAKAGKATADTAVSVAHFLGKLTDPHFWLRALEVVGGIVLVLLGLYLLARNVGLASSPPGPVGELLPVGKAARLSDSAAAELQFSPGRAAYQGPRTRRRSFEATEAGQRRQELRRRSELAQPSDEIPF